MAGKTLYRYLGTRPYEDTDDDRKLFFGRDREKEDLLQRIIAGKLVVVHAESGIGKTSLLNAGVSELLRKRGYIPVKVRFNMAKISPVQTVFDAITETVKQRGLDIEPGETESLWQYFKTAAFWSGDDKLLTPVLIFDQFEEFFGFHEPDARKEFTQQLADLVHNTLPPLLRQAVREGQPYRYGETPPRVKIVISIRADYLAQLDELSTDIPEILESRFRLLALTREQARQAIISPAQLEIEGISMPRFRYAEEAVNAVLDYLSKRREKEGVANKDEVEPFQLQVLCQHIETNVLERVGKPGDQGEYEVKIGDLGGEAGIHKVFQFFYEKQLAGLKFTIQKRRVRRLCEKGMISPSYRRLSLAEEYIETEYKVSPVLLQQLVRNRLLRMDRRGTGVYYELSHDSLVAPIRLSQRKRRLTREKYALIFLVPVLFAAVILMILRGDRVDTKQNELNALFKAAEQLSFDSKNYLAIEKYRKILEIAPKNIMAIVKLGELLSEDRKYEFALQLYKKAIAIGVSDIRMNIGYWKMLFRTGKEEEALTSISESIKRNPRQVEAFEMLGDHYKDKRDFKIAIENYEKVLVINKYNKRVYEKLAISYLENGEKGKVFDVFKRAITVDVEYAEIYEKIRDVLKQSGNVETLEELYGLALDVKCEDAYYYIWLGNDYDNLKKYDSAIASYKKAIELEPSLAEAYNNMGNAQSNKGDNDGAIASYKKALELKPNDAMVYNNIGIAFRKKGDINAAIASYQKALELKPDYALAYNNMGNVQYEKGEFDASIANYQKAIELKADCAEAYNNLGLVFANKGETDAALNSFQKALELKPDYAEAYCNLGITQDSKGDYDAAISSFQKALELTPEDEEVYYNMGIAQDDKGDFEAAITSYEQALEINPSFLLAKENLTEVYLITGRLNKALTLAQQVLKEKGIEQYEILAMNSIVISSLFFQDKRDQALIELQQLITYYRGLPDDFKRDWEYNSIKKFLTQTQRLNAPTRALLLKMIELLKTPRKDSAPLLVELEKMVKEYKR